MPPLSSDQISWLVNSLGFDPAALQAPVPSRGDGSRLTAPLGSVGPHNRQGLSLRDPDTNARLSESEHIEPKSILQELTTDPATGQSPYTEAAYRQSPTLKLGRDTALEKTSGDMDALRALQADPTDPAALADASLEAGINRTLDAVDVTGDASVSEEAVNLAAHGQLGVMHEVGRPGVRDALDGLSDAEIDAAVDQLDTPTLAPDFAAPKGMGIPLRSQAGDAPEIEPPTFEPPTYEPQGEDVPAMTPGTAPTEFPPDPRPYAPTQQPGPAPDFAPGEVNPYEPYNPSQPAMTPDIPPPPRVPDIVADPTRLPPGATPGPEPSPLEAAPADAEAAAGAESGLGSAAGAGLLGAGIAGGIALAGDYDKVTSGQMSVTDAAEDVGGKAAGMGGLTYAGSAVADAVVGGAGSEAAAVSAGAADALAGAAGGEAGAVAGAVGQAALKGGVIGGVVAGGLALYDDVGKVNSGQMTAGTATVDVGAKTAVGVAAGLAGAEIGAVIGTAIPIPIVGTAVGFVAGAAVGAAVGYVGNKLMETDTGKAVIDAAGQVVDADIAAVKAAAGAVADGAVAVGGAVSDAAGAAADGAEAAAGAVSDAASGLLGSIEDAL